MNTFQKCSFTSDALPLYLPQQLYLKPIAQITITVHLPAKLVGKVISNWEMMEKLRALIVPDEFSILKVSKNTLELIKFHAELEDKKKLNRVLDKLDNKLVKLKDFHDLFRVRALEARLNFPNKHGWDSFFRETKDMNEMKAGERPDTMHICNLPIRWFVSVRQGLGEEDEHLKPSEKIFYRIFEKFGRIRHVDVPICDPYRKEMKSQISGLQTFSFDDKDFFEGYVQFKDYAGFTKAMDAFRGMKLLRKDKEANENYMVDIKIDFDKTKHMTEGSIRRREIVRERLIRKQREHEEKERIQNEQSKKELEDERQKELELKEEKEKRRREREENRKARILAQLKIKDANEINDKIAREEKKLLRAQRKLEAIRLVEELFRRVKNKQSNLGHMGKSHTSDDIWSKYKQLSEKEFNNRQNNLHHSIAGRVLLKTILTGEGKRDCKSSSSETSLSLDEEDNNKSDKKEEGYQPPLLYQYPQMQNNIYPYFAPVSLPMREQPYFPYPPKGRGFFKGAGPSRGYRRGRGNYNYRNMHKNLSYYPPELQAEYYRYFAKFLNEHDDRNRRTYGSRSRSRSRSPSYRQSRSRRSRSYNRSRRSYTKRSYTRSRSQTRSRSRSTRRSNRSKGSKSRSKSKKPRSGSKESVDSSKFVSPNTLRRRRSRSWTMPISAEKGDRRTWSRSPSRGK